MKKNYVKPEVTKEELQKMLLETNEKLCAANEKLVQQEQERTALFANLSHDLRSSLAVIAGAAELLEAEWKERDGEVSEIIKLIEKRTSSMQRIVEEMFFLAKLESSGIRIDLQRIDLRIFLEDYFWSVKEDPRFKEKNLSLEIEDDFSGDAIMDPELMVRVLDNLFDNARKYSRNGAEIVLSVYNKGEQEFLVCVRDNGRGIPKEDLPHIFERTFRGSRARTPEEGSSGLGLSIVKSIVELNGGSISCESEEEKGSCFSFTLKRA